MWCQGMNCVSFCWEGLFFCNRLTFRANKHCQYYPLNFVWKFTSYKLLSKQILYVRSKGKFHTNPNQKFKFAEHVNENSNDQWTAPPGIVHWGINNIQVLKELELFSTMSCLETSCTFVYNMDLLHHFSIKCCMFGRNHNKE